MVVNSTSENEQGDFSDRDYFSYHRTHDDNDLHIGAPIRGRTVDGWLDPGDGGSFNRADGSFGGVAVAAINPEVFSEYL